ncbi:hypothetical protein ASE95_16000 [Sphingomonas sp. Leaf231]|nr:hypothetical protein ASE95_16000 [Sphingomonas sp. Leaf231]
MEDPSLNDAFALGIEPLADPIDILAAQGAAAGPRTTSGPTPLSADDLDAVMNVPVRVRAVLGRARMDLERLLRLQSGDVIELDRRAGEPIDIFVNDRFVARGEIVLIDDVLGVTLTEIARRGQ